MRIILLVSFLLTCILGYTQTGILSGTVRDEVTTAPITGLAIQIPSTNQFFLTDLFGKFRTTPLLTGRYEIVVNAQGYHTKTIVVDVTGDSITHISLALQRSPLELSAITVSTRRSRNPNTIAAVDIQLRPVNTSQDILRIVPGLFIAQHAGGGKADQLFLRGFDIDHGTDVAETVDGLPVNMVSHAHGQGYADLHFLIPELVEKVDFDKGPYSTTNGNFATAGWVDFKTRDFLPSNSIKLEGGSFGHKRITGLLKLVDRTKEDTRQQWYAASEVYMSDGYFEDAQDFHRVNFFSKYTGWFSNSTHLSVSASVFNSKWKASGQIPERAVQNGIITRFGSIDNSEGGRTSRNNLNIRLSKQLDHNWLLTQQAFVSQYGFNLYSNFTFFLNDTVNGDAIQQREQRMLYGYNGSFTKDHFIYGNPANTVLGYGIRADCVSDIELNKVARRIFLGHVAKGDVKEFNTYLFINNRIDLTDRLELNTGIRLDHFRFGYRDDLSGSTVFQHRNAGTISPKVNLSFDVSQKIKLTLHTGFGFHSNDSRVILNQQADKILPKVFGSDMGVILKPSRSLLVKASLWYLYSQQEFVYVGDEGIVEPSGRSRRTGIDIAARYQPWKWLFLDLDMNMANPRSIDESKGNDYVPLAPTFTSAGGVTIKPGKRFNGSFRYRLLGDRPANEDNSVTAKGYMIADLLASYTVKKLIITLSVENLFNEEWNEAQFDTESRLFNETQRTSEIHFTPGTPRFIKLATSFNF